MNKRVQINFNRENDGWTLLYSMKKLIGRYNQVTVEDFYNLWGSSNKSDKCGDLFGPDFKDQLTKQIGWTDLENSFVIQVEKFVWRLDLQPPKDLSMDKDKGNLVLKIIFDDDEDPERVRLLEELVTSLLDVSHINAAAQVGREDFEKGFIDAKDNK